MLKTTFGQSKNGETISLYSFENAKQMKMVLTDFGAVLTQLWVPDKEGNLNDVVLGFDTLAEYEVNPTYFGATIGRSCNRIKNGTFKINDISYQLKKMKGRTVFIVGQKVIIYVFGKLLRLLIIQLHLS